MGGATSIFKQPPGADEKSNKKSVEIHQQKEVSVSHIKKTKLKIITVNDVYDLKLLSHVKTCKIIESENYDGKVILTLPGDFLSPSILSSLDGGKGMVECLNDIGIDYVCFGNHEGDISHQHLIHRIEESNFLWVNTNMKNFSIPSHIQHKVPEHVCVTIDSNKKASTINEISNSVVVQTPEELKQALDVRRVALLGLITEDPKLYRKGVFNNANIIPLFKSAKEEHERLTNEKFTIIHDTDKVLKNKYDMIIPLTHQDVPKDRDLAKTGLFNVILGGHDHEVYVEHIFDDSSNNPAYDCHVVKVGIDAENIGIIEFIWDNYSDDHNSKPTISVVMKSSTEYKRDVHCDFLIEKHQQLLIQVQKAPLFTIPDVATISKGEDENRELIQNLFSSVDTRLKTSLLATFLCNVIKDSLQVDCVLLNAGCIRGNTDYTFQKQFFYADLEKEMPFPTEIAVLELPCEVIIQCIVYSRGFSFYNPPISTAVFQHCDDGIIWDEDTNHVVAINNILIKDIRDRKEKKFLVGMLQPTLEGLDDLVPLTYYLKHGVIMNYNPDHATNNRRHSIPVGSTGDMIIPAEDSCIGAKKIIVSYFAKSLLFSIIESLGLDNIDTNKDKTLCRAELEAAVHKKAILDQQRQKSKNIAESKENDEIVTDETVNKLVVDNMFTVADIDNNGVITVSEIMALKLSTMNRLSTLFNSMKDTRKAHVDGISNAHLPIDMVAAKQLLMESLGLDETDEDMTMMMDVLSKFDKDQDGRVSIDEIRAFIHEHLSSTAARVKI